MSTTFPSSWPTWLKELFGWTPPPPLFQPLYQTGANLTVSEPGGGTQILNPQYFVTFGTAQQLSELYPATIKLEPYEGAGGPDTSSAIEYHLVFAPDNLDINAGLLAYYYRPAGPASNPNIADPTLVPGSPGSGASAAATLDDPSLAVTECNAMIANARLQAAGKVALRRT
jgi:hypothetical protein